MIESRRTGEACLSDLALDRWVAGELAAAERIAAERHVDACPACARRREAIVAEAAMFEQQAPGFEAPAVVLRPRTWLRPTLIGAALALAAALVLLLVPRLREGGGELPDDAGGRAPIASSEDPRELVRVKGGEALGVFVRSQGQTRVAATGDVVHPGDELRFTYSTRAAAELAIVGIDERGTAYRVHPVADRSVAVQPGRELAIDASLRLDETLGAERFWGVFCPAPFETQAIVEAVTARPTAPQLPDGCRGVALVLHKQAR